MKGFCRERNDSFKQKIATSFPVVWWILDITLKKKVFHITTCNLSPLSTIFFKRDYLLHSNMVQVHHKRRLTCSKIVCVTYVVTWSSKLKVVQAWSFWRVCSWSTWQPWSVGLSWASRCVRCQSSPPSTDRCRNHLCWHTVHGGYTSETRLNIHPYLARRGQKNWNWWGKSKCCWELLQTFVGDNVAMLIK